MSTDTNDTKMKTDEGFVDSGYNSALTSSESSLGSVNGNGHSPSISMANGSIHQTTNGLNGTGGMTVTATIGTSSPRPRRRGGSRPGSWAGSGVSVTQEVLPGQGQGHVDTVAATLLRPASGNEGSNSTVQTNYSVHSNSQHNTKGNILGHVSIGQMKEEVDQKPGQKVPVKQECNGRVKGPHEYNHRPHSGPQQNRTQPPKPEPETMDIPVKIFDTGRTKTFTLPATSTVEDLLRDIKKEEPKYKDMPNDQIRLQQGGKNLQTGMKLDRCDIKNKGTVHLSGRLRGG